MASKKVPLAKAIELGDLDEKTAWMMFDPSPEAEIEWIESLLTIPNEKGQIVRMKLYPQQKRMLQERTGRDITVKGRQTRASSLILARNVRQITTRSGITWLVMTQDDQTTATFRARITHHLHDLERAGWSLLEGSINNEREIVIAGLENRVLFASGQQKVAGRGISATICHLSELSHWPNQEMARQLIGSILPAVPGAPHGQFDIESTPNGVDDVFHDYTMDAKPYNPNSLWTAHFYPWWLEPRYKVGTTLDCDIVLPEDEYRRQVEEFVPAPQEEILQHNYHLSVDQLLWRRYKYREMAKTGVPFEQEYPESIEGCFVSMGDSFFRSPDGIDHLVWYRENITQPLLVKDSLEYKGGRVSFFGPNLHIWELPRAGQPYCGWVDLAGGGLDEKADYSVLVVLNAKSKRHVATLRLKAAPNEFAPMVAAVMTFYNTGLLGGERDAYGNMCLAVLKEMGYPNLWYYTDFENAPPRPGKVLEAWAHPTQIRNRMLNRFREYVFAHAFLTHDRQLIMEMSAFTWGKIRGNRESMKAAGKGQKDDMVMAAAGAVYISDYADVGGPGEEEEKRDTILVGPGGVVVGRRNIGEYRPWLR